MRDALNLFLDGVNRAGRMLLGRLGIIAAVLMVLVAAGARAQVSGPTVKVPLTIDYVTLSKALERQLYTRNGRAPLWNGSNTCQYLYARQPVFSRKGDKLSLETDASLRIGVPLGSQCMSPIQWNGIIEAETAPYVSAHMLKLRVTDINLLNPEHEKTLIAGKGFDLVKQYFIPRLETFEFDLEPATQQLRTLSEAASPPEVAKRVKATLATMRVLPEIAALDEGIRATIELTLPALPATSPQPAPAQLTPQELAAFEKQVDQWDAFLVFAIKQLGGLNNGPQFREDLLDLLLDGRYRLIDALAHPQSGGADPVRLLFLDEWKRLGQIVRTAALHGTLGERSLEFLSFISAGDALFALDQAAPALGMRVSADDLRRLAHIMAPQAKGDPLGFSFDLDPELRKMFGIEEPLESEGPLVTEPSQLPTATPTASTSAVASPAAPESAPPIASTPSSVQPPPPARSPSPAAATPGVGTEVRATPTATVTAPAVAVPTSAPAPGERPTSMREFPSWLMDPPLAYAAEAAPLRSTDIVTRLQRLGRKLGRALADDRGAQQYRADMEQLLELAGLREINAESIDSQDQGVYAKLVKAAAWQESCWRQFVLKGNRVVYLESSSHDVGLMQVNRYVWRGFYAIARLEWDILYNATAGMEILARLLEGVENKRGATIRGKPDDLARSTYAAYNGGPGAYRRWRGHESRDKRFIDESFWAKYQAVSRGQQIDILSCAAQWGKTPGH